MAANLELSSPPEDVPFVVPDRVGKRLRRPETEAGSTRQSLRAEGPSILGQLLATARPVEALRGRLALTEMTKPGNG